LRPSPQRVVKLEWLTVILLIVNFFATYSFDLETFRLTRMISLAVLVLYFLFHKRVKGLLLVIAFAFFMSREVGYQFFESLWGTEWYMASAMLGYLFLFLDRLPFIKYGFSIWIIVLALILIAATLTILVTLGELARPNLNSHAELIFFYGYGIALIFLILAAFYYNHVLNSTRSLLYTFMVFGFMMSDIAACLAYYNKVTSLYYVDRGFFILSMAMLTHFGLNLHGAKRERKDLKMLR